jgi:Glycosyl transferase family 2/Glycosyltransferase family 25 (LPS biosynthesis protein)
VTSEIAGTSRKALTIGMATYDDYDGVYFTVQAIRLFHPEVTEETEIIVVDNHPEGPCAADLKALENWVTGYRYIPFNRIQGTAARDVVFREANTDCVLCVDCHVMFAPGALRQLVDYFQAHPDTRDLLQGPLVYDDLRTLSTHMDPTWSAGMYGVWGSDARAGDPAASPFEIAQQGLGAFACRKSEWPGLNPRLRGFGGEEGYLQQKFRRAGGRTLCLPFLRWVHRFGRPMGVPYQNTWEDRLHNYLIIADELGHDPAPALEHFRQHLGCEAAERIVGAVRQELSSPFHFFDAIYCINLAEDTGKWREASARFERLGIAARIRRLEAIRTQPNLHIGCGLSHRAVIAEAKAQGLENVLVFEDDVRFTSDALCGLRQALDELRGREWSLLYLGACRWNRETPPLPGCRRLALAGPVTCTHAVAYHRSVFDRILNDVPNESAGMERWLQIHRGIDQYYAFSLTEKKFLLSPVVATQTSILPMENVEVQRLLD